MPFDISLRNNGGASFDISLSSAPPGVCEKVGWSGRASITIPASNIDAALTNYVVAVQLSDMPAGWWAAVKSDGGDIRVTGADGSTEMPIHLSSFDYPNNKGILFFRAALSDSLDNLFYIYVGNAGASMYANSNPLGRNAVYVAYEAVYHFNQTPDGTAGQIEDSTGNGNDGQSFGLMGIANVVAGILDGGTAYDFNSALSQYIRLPDIMGGAAALTASYFIKDPVYDDGRVLSSGGTGVDQVLLWPDNDNGFDALVDGVRANGGAVEGYTGWNTHAMRYTGATVFNIENGIESGSVAKSGNIISRGIYNYIGRDASGVYTTATVAGVRIALADLGTAYLKAESINMRTPGTFYSVGTFTECSSGPTTESITKSASYRILLTGLLTKTAEYAIGSVTALTKSARYAIKTAEALTKSASYEIVTSLSITKAARYAVLTLGLIQKGASYSITTVEALTKSAQYAIFTSSAITKAGSYLILTTSLIQKLGEYSVVTVLAITKPAQYLITSSVALTKSATYSVETVLALTKSATYQVLTTSALTKSARYVLSGVSFSLTKSAQYAILLVTAITKSAQYAILNVDQITKPAQYFIKRTITLQLSASYEVLTSLALTKSAQYFVLYSSTLTKQAIYSIETSSAIQKGARYVIKLVGVINLGATYVVELSTTIVKAGRYAILNTGLLQLSAEYVIKSIAAIQLTAQYAITLAPVVITKPATYRVTQRYPYSNGDTPYSPTPSPFSATTSPYSPTASPLSEMSKPYTDFKK